MARQQCPGCDRFWQPPGPCSHMVGGEVCGFVERERPADRPATRRPTESRPLMPSDGYAATGPVADPSDHVATARARLAQIEADRRRRGLPTGRTAA